jgi:flagellar motility protein MotE (MotC chaperone)
MARRYAGQRRGALQVLAVFLILSAVLRAGAQIGPAFANEPVDIAPAAAQPAAPTDELLAAFQAREARLTAREDQLRDRLQALRVAEAEIEEKLTAMRDAEQALNASIAQAETASIADLDLLTAVYENMKPKEAAALFEQMQPQFAAGFLAMMQPAAAALIMSELLPETAYSFSVVIAGRNANAPTQ